MIHKHIECHSYAFSIPELADRLALPASGFRDLVYNKDLQTLTLWFGGAEKEEVMVPGRRSDGE